MLSEAQDGYKNMPSIFHFALSAVNLVAVGVYTSEPLPKGIPSSPMHSNLSTKQSYSAWLIDRYSPWSVRWKGGFKEPRGQAAVSHSQRVALGGLLILPVRMPLYHLSIRTVYY